MPDDEFPQRLLAPVAAGASLVVPAALAMAMHEVVLFASLGPTAVMQAQTPEHRSSSLHSVVVSHLVGFTTAGLLVILFGLQDTPSVFQVHAVTATRAMIAVASIVVATAIEIVLRAPHPPAGSTTLLVALGSMKPTWQTFGLVVLGVVSVGTAGEVIRRCRTSQRRRSGTPPTRRHEGKGAAPETCDPPPHPQC